MPGIGKTLTCDQCDYSAEVLDGVNHQMVSLTPATCNDCRLVVTAVDRGLTQPRTHRCPQCDGTALTFIPVRHDRDDRIGPTPCPKCQGTLESDREAGMTEIIMWD
jgi:predicted Zn-ribbon and HTH transcriptional regulator